MKSRIITLLVLFCTLAITAQQAINYKALIKDNLGNVVANQSVTIQFTILEGAGATTVYQEDHTVNTDANGICIVNIGAGNILNGDYNTIDWGSDDHFLNVQIDSGSGLVDLGTTQFMAVPYALYAETSGSGSGISPTGLEALDEGNGNGWSLIGRNPNNYGNIGKDAVDLSIVNNTASDTFGATGSISFASGNGTTASGQFSTAMGYGTIASESYSTAMGNGTEASGFNSTAMGAATEASGNSSTALGFSTISSGSRSLATGFNTTASATNSTAMGDSTTASATNSTAMGDGTTASGWASTAMGDGTTASGWASTSMGEQTIASGVASTAMGFGTRANQLYSTVVGIYNDSISSALFKVGNGLDDNNRSDAFLVKESGQVLAPSLEIVEISNPKSLITKEYADANLSASGLEALDEGNGNGWRLIGQNSNNYGNIGSNATDLSFSGGPSDTRGATGISSFASGSATTASGLRSSALGYVTLATGDQATAMGWETQATAINATAIGYKAIASGNTALAFGQETDASGSYSVAGGKYTAATADQAVALGFNTQATSFNSTALGFYTVADDADALVVGRYNDPALSNILFQVGNGTADISLSNALNVFTDGTITAPSFNVVDITDPKHLITKEYADANYSGGGSGTSPTGLEALDEGNGTGWRLVGSDPANFGDIGSNAIDLSTSSNPSSVNGATGPFSLAIGNNAEASGIAAMAIGFNSKAQNSGAIAIGGTVTGEGALAMAGGNASGQSSFAQGLSSVSSASYATALGNGTTASGDYAVAVGHNTTSSGWNSFSSGVNTEASGTQATAMGAGTVASGHSSTALGIGTKAEAPNTTAIGLYNIGGGDPLLASASDPLFEVGNGQYVDGVNDIRTNALTVLRNGTITAPTFDMAEITDPKALITKEYADANYSGGGSGTSSTGLEALDEGNGSGWRLIGTDPANYGSIGSKSVDFSFSSTPSTTYGATGSTSIAVGTATTASGDASSAFGAGTTASGPFSFSSGYYTTASGNTSTAFGSNTIADDSYSTVVGQYNNETELSNVAFQVGNGTSSGSKSNALNVTMDGIITAPSLDIVEITDSKTLITKEYADANLSSTGLEALDEGNGNGWRLVGSNPDNFGNIGGGAIDLSVSTSASSVKGATGSFSFASGNNSSAIGVYSVAMGINTIASGVASTAIGSGTRAYGDSSLAMNDSNAYALFSSTFGTGNIISGGDPSTWVNTDPLFEIGNGYFFVNQNALTILKNGYTTFGTHEVLPTTDFQINHDNDGTINGLKLQNKEWNENWWRFYTLNSNGQLYLYSKAGGNASPVGSFDDASGTYTALSDRRAKANFKDLYFNWQEFMQLQPLTYHYKTDENKKSHIGFVAQDVEPIYPELVNHNKEEDLYQLNYSGFGVVAIKAIQELKKENEQLKALLLKEEESNTEQSQLLQVLLERVEALEKQQSNSTPVELVKN